MTVILMITFSQMGELSNTNWIRAETSKRHEERINTSEHKNDVDTLNLHSKFSTSPSDFDSV